MESDAMLLQTLCLVTVLFSLQSSGSFQWPAETYGIPKPKAGCPQAVGFRWKTGWRLQRDAWHYQNKGSQSNNSRSLEFHIDGKVDRFTVNRSFCMKEDTTKDFLHKRPTWPPGKYCIYKGNDPCPKNLTSGWVFWEDSYSNDESDGFLPDGDYSQFTEIDFCCRTDGDKDVPILLPSKSPFFLLAYESAKCQMVKWAVASMEWIYYYTLNEEDDQRNGSYPYNAGKMHPTIYYCYYQGCNKTLTTVSGTLKSPNYPKHYPNGQYCSWKIIVNTTQQVHLVFKSFSLQIERFTDELRVYDGVDETGEVLGVFYGGHPPPKEGIYSSSSQVFLIFKSDKNDSYTGFSASYSVGNKTGSIQWPAGTYGIPKPIAGCPQVVGFRWKTGWRLQRDAWHYQNIGSHSNNTRSLEFHIDGKVDTFTVNRSFCMKEDTAKDSTYKRPTWPRGKYCIYKGTDPCPKDLTFGWVFWEDSYGNDESDGFLPDGDYWKYTEIHFCCRTDGDKDVPILLPSNFPFFLLAYESAKCQMVKWAVASVEWIYYYTHNEEDDQRNGSYPYNAGKMHPTIYYCYYRGCNKTLAAVSGTLKSPNYPKHYPNGQHCSWKIIVNTTQPIHIVFKSFSLQIERFTDELRVYDGEDETGEVLGVFYGGHPPPKDGIYSSSSRMFLIFKSDKTVSYTGFSASYFVGSKTVRRVTTTKAPTPATRMTPSHFLISKTSIASKVNSSSTVTSSTTKTLKVTSSPVVPTTSSTQAWGMVSSSYVISMTLQTPEVTHFSPITSTTDTLIKTTTRGKLWSSTTEVPPKKGYNETLTAVNGTLQSANCPRKYSDGQYCFWRIVVTTAKQLHLIFSNFSLQNENNTDAIFVYDGGNAKGKPLKVFHGDHHPPEEGICISSNRIFVEFKSDNAGSFHSFSASYHGVNNSESCAFAASQRSKESGKKEERKQPHRKGLSVVAVVVPVVSAILLAALVVAGICYIRKRRKRVEGPDDEIYLRLSSEPTMPDESTDL